VHELSRVAPAFVEMAHRIVWCVVATVDRSGAPRTRVLHPIWEWDGERLQGWIATSPNSPKAADLAREPRISLTYWAPDHDTCTAECSATWQDDAEDRRRGWERFAHGPAPVGYDPSIIPQWTSPEADEFGLLHLRPSRLRLMPGSLMLAGRGELLTWRSDAGA
jgi:general stress protein 26